MVDPIDVQVEDVIEASRDHIASKQREHARGVLPSEVTQLLVKSRCQQEERQQQSGHAITQHRGDQADVLHLTV
jgi:hypothetical protein